MTEIKMDDAPRAIAMFVMERLMHEYVKGWIKFYRRLVKGVERYYVQNTYLVSKPTTVFAYDKGWQKVREYDAAR